MSNDGAFPQRRNRRPRHDPPRAIREEVDRTLDLLQGYLKRRKRTQRFVQQRYGWGRTSLSQLFRRQKRLRYDQLLQILAAIEVPPLEFFTELFTEEAVVEVEPVDVVGPLFANVTDVDGLSQVVDVLVASLLQRGHLSTEELSALQSTPEEPS